MTNKAVDTFQPDYNRRLDTPEGQEPESYGQENFAYFMHTMQLDQATLLISEKLDALVKSTDFLSQLNYEDIGVLYEYFDLIKSISLNIDLLKDGVTKINTLNLLVKIIYILNSIGLRSAWGDHIDLKSNFLSTLEKLKYDVQLDLLNAKISRSRRHIDGRLP